MFRSLFPKLVVLSSLLVGACALPASEDAAEATGQSSSAWTTPKRSETIIVKNLTSELDAIESDLSVYLSTTDPVVRAVVVIDVRTRRTRAISLASELLAVTTDAQMAASAVDVRSTLQQTMTGSSELEMMRLQSEMSRLASVLTLMNNLLNAQTNAIKTIVGNMK